MTPTSPTPTEEEIQQASCGMCDNDEWHIYRQSQSVLLFDCASCGETGGVLRLAEDSPDAR